MWNLTPPPGFQGLSPDKPVTVYHRHLPHWRQDGATYFVTFRLEDSLPQAKLRELRQYKAEWQKQHPPPHQQQALENLTREIMRRVECWLDQGMGSCALRDPRAGQSTTKALHHFDSERYELDSYVVMPNHVHAILRPLLPGTHPLERILQSWKRHTAREINVELGLEGTLWQEESFDRIIRDEEHVYRAIQYIGTNPRRAGLARGQCPLWINPSWEQLGWGFEET